MGDTRVGLVIEDDHDIRELVRVVLTQAGFEVRAASSGAEGVLAAKELDPAVITLDLGLPDIDGFEVARQIRQFSDAYIVMLTARAEELDTLIGLESGADDYLTKPFRPRELRARVAAMMRRPRSTPDLAEEAGSPAVAANEGRKYSHNGLDLSYESRTVAVDGQELSLTRTEFDLLHALLEAGRMVRTKADLVRRLRDEPYDVGSYISEADERSVEVHMGNLRKKLGDSAQNPRWLQTVRGVGYRLAPAEIWRCASSCQPAARNSSSCFSTEDRSLQLALPHREHLPAVVFELTALAGVAVRACGCASFPRTRRWPWGACWPTLQSWKCQKQPLTKMTLRRPAKTRSGLPGSLTPRRRRAGGTGSPWRAGGGGPAARAWCFCPGCGTCSSCAAQGSAGPPCFKSRPAALLEIALRLLAKLEVAATHGIGIDLHVEVLQCGHPGGEPQLFGLGNLC